MSARRMGMAALLAIGAGSLYWAFTQPLPAPAHDARAALLRQPPVTTDTTPRAAAPPASTGTPRTAEPPAVGTTAPTAPRDHLDAETDLLGAVDGHRGLNVAAIDALVKGERFDAFMDRLAGEAVASPLAQDVDALYAQSAARANAAVGDRLGLRLVCGMTVCGLSATAPSKEVFDAWFERFIADPTAPPYGAGRHDKVTDSGAIEYRIVFSTDPDRQHVVMPKR